MLKTTGIVVVATFAATARRERPRDSRAAERG